MKKLLYLPLALLLVQCVSTKQTRFHGATESAQVQIPVGIKEMSVLNRTRPLKGNILNTLATGQSSYTNRPGVNETLASFKSEVRKRKYFSINGYSTKVAKAEQTDTLPFALSVDEIAEFYQGDFLMASLEVFQVYETQQFIPERKMQLDTNGNEYYINTVRATKTLMSKSGWRLYNSTNGDVLDEFILDHDHTYEVIGINRQNAIEKMELRIPQAYKDLGTVIGFMYAERVSPVSIYVSRNYYAKSKSCPELKEAVEFIKLDDWETAKSLWEDGLKRSDGNKDLAKLHFNLGVYYERSGDLDNAIAQLEKSKQFDSQIGSGYLNMLRTVKRSGYPKNY